MHPIRIETPRLLIRRFVPADSGPFSEVLTDPEAMYFSADTVFTPADARREVKKHVKNESLLAVELKEQHRVIGRLYFHDARFFGAYEIGYLFHRQYWGNGYAYEAAYALTSYAFLRLGIRRLTACADIRNTRSLRLLEKLGMRREGVRKCSAFFQIDQQGEPVWSDFCDYAILRDEFIQMAREHSQPV